MAITRCPECETANRVPEDADGHPRCAKCKTDLAWLVNADDAGFDDAISTPLLTLVDLWAPWCGPCRMVGPILETMAAEFAGRLKVVKVNVDENQKTSARFHASSIPMMLFIKDGEVIETVVGAQPEHVMRSKIEGHLAG